MKLSMHITNQGISLSFGSEELIKLVRAETANQERPRRSYVYGHFDVHGIPFYIGKGTGRRAWSRDRDPLWERYLATRLGGLFEVVILQDDLSSEEAECLESDWIAQEFETLINWVNAGRRIDFAALDRFHMLRNKNREAMARAKAMEKTDLAGAIAAYTAALEALAEYANIEHETGLVGQLLKERKEETGIFGDIHLLDRLTLCLCRAKLHGEARKTVDQYFELYRADLLRTATAKILKRVEPPAPERR